MIHTMKSRTNDQGTLALNPIKTLENWIICVATPAMIAWNKSKRRKEIVKHVAVRRDNDNFISGPIRGGIVGVNRGGYPHTSWPADVSLTPDMLDALEEGEPVRFNRKRRLESMRQGMLHPRDEYLGIPEEDV